MIIGIDYSLMQVRAAQKFCRQKQISNCAFQQGNAMALQFQDKSYDAVVSVGSIKHWPDGLQGMKEIYRVLKPGGWCIISETDQEATNDELWQFVRRFHIRLIPASVVFWGLRHIVFGESYNEQSLMSLAREAGFRNIECRRVSTCPYVIIKAQK
jgi:ubiquinone/menaquinone biosynthesis C-methylase UbiE